MAPTAGHILWSSIFSFNYRGPADVNVITSYDRGATWRTTFVDSSARPPGCSEAAGCTYGFLSTTAGLAIDQSGKLLLAYHAGDVAKEPQTMYVSTSDDGVNWTPRLQISQPNEEASNGFPAVARIGRGRFPRRLARERKRRSAWMGYLRPGNDRRRTHLGQN